MQLTPRSLQLFLAYASDAKNWSGTPLVGGNLGGSKEDRGNLTHLKRAGLIRTFRYDGETWIEFTPLGKELAREHGVVLNPVPVHYHYKVPGGKVTKHDHSGGVIAHAHPWLRGYGETRKFVSLEYPGLERTIRPLGLAWNPTPKKDVAQRKRLLEEIRRRVEEGSLSPKFLSGAMYMDTEELEKVLRKNPLLETLGTYLVAGAGFGAGSALARKAVGERNPVKRRRID